MTRIYDPRETAVNIANAEAREPDWAVQSVTTTYTLPPEQPDGETWPDGATVVDVTFYSDADSDYSAVVKFRRDGEPVDGDDVAVNWVQAMVCGDVALCRACGQWIEDEPNVVGWVSVVSGDNGGTYDLCPTAPLGLHLPPVYANLLP